MGYLTMNVVNRYWGDVEASLNNKDNIIFKNGNLFLNLNSNRSIEFYNTGHGTICSPSQIRELHKNMKIYPPKHIKRKVKKMIKSSKKDKKKKFVVLEGIEHKNCFYTTNDPDYDHRRLINGEIAYNILGYTNTSDEALSIIDKYTGTSRSDRIINYMDKFHQKHNLPLVSDYVKELLVSDIENIR